MAHPKHQQVRKSYHFACGYCGVREVDAGGELTVDHFRPISAGGADDDENLVYSCVRCNLYKGDFFPSARDLEAGRRVLHPLQDNPDTHLRLNASTGRLEPLSVTGAFHVETLQLNRPALIAGRQQRINHEATVVRNQALEAENQRLRELLEALSDDDILTD